MKKKYRQSLLIALAALSLLFLGRPKSRHRIARTQKLIRLFNYCCCLKKNRQGLPISFLSPLLLMTGIWRSCGSRSKMPGLCGSCGPTQEYLQSMAFYPSVNAIDRLGGARGWVRVDGNHLLTQKQILWRQDYYP